MKVQNMTSNNGNKIANQFIIYDDDIWYFQSYKSIIVMKDTLNDTVYLDSKYWDYSTTTSKYRNIFLGEKKKDTEKKIKEGIYVLTDLNTIGGFIPYRIFARKRILDNARGNNE